MVNLGEHSYPIYIKQGILQEVGSYIGEIFHGKKIMIISDDTVYGYYGEQVKGCLEGVYQCYTHIIEHGEQSKNLDTAKEIFTSLIDANLTRSDLIIALGGGVVGDLAGFVASTYLRGVAFVQIPTTLLAQVDSSVGGKVAVDLPQGKNLVGSFYHPKLVLIDPSVLDTLTDGYFKDGMGEVIKYGCIQSRILFERLASYQSKEALLKDMEEIIYICVDCKREVVEEDEKDTGRRMILNFGHTLGHALEQYYGYVRESHGEAVAIGMYQIMKQAEEQGIVEKGMAQEIQALLQCYGLPTACDVENIKLLDGIRKDKKNLDGALNIILLQEIGEAYIYKTTTDFFVS